MICRDCSCDKEPEDMVKNIACVGGYDSLCLECNRRRVKEWRAANPDKRKLQQKRESTVDKVYNKRKHLKHTYGITIDEYDGLYNKQQGHCAICGIHQSESQRTFHLDHCHSTGKIRGLLCPNCNHLLGHAKDSCEILLQAVKYLNQPDTGY